MEQPRGQQPALLPDQLPGAGCHDDLRRGVPEPLQHDPGRTGGGAGVHGLRVGRPQQGHPPPAEEAVPHGLRHGGHAGQLRPHFHVRGSHGLRVRHHFSSAVDVHPRLAAAAEPQEQAGEQDGGDRSEEDAHGHRPGRLGAAGGEHQQVHRLHQQSEGVGGRPLGLQPGAPPAAPALLCF